MNTTNTIEKNWSEIKAKIKAQWSKFSEEEVESVKKDFSQLAAKLQKSYDLTKEDAERQFSDFKKSVAALLVESCATDAPKVDAKLATPAGDQAAVDLSIPVKEMANTSGSKATH